MTKKPQFLSRPTQTFTLLGVLGLFVLAPSALADDAWRWRPRTSA